MGRSGEGRGFVDVATLTPVVVVEPEGSGVDIYVEVVLVVVGKGVSELDDDVARI